MTIKKVGKAGIVIKYRGISRAFINVPLTQAIRETLSFWDEYQDIL